MGLHISKESALAPISAASTIIGFISFAFTLSTFFRVFWGNIMTIINAKREIPDLLGNVKQELYEERDHLRTVRRRRRANSESDRTMRVLYDAVRNMLQDFKALERRFLVHPHEYWEPYSSGYYADEKGGGVKRGGRWVRDRGYTDEDDYENTEYLSVSLWQRMVWIKTRTAVNAIAGRLSRIQTRRIARQTTAVAGDTRYLCQTIQDIEERMYALEQRLSNIVGVRRVD